MKLSEKEKDNVFLKIWKYETIAEGIMAITPDPPIVKDNSRRRTYKHYFPTPPNIENKNSK